MGGFCCVGLGWAVGLLLGRWVDYSWFKVGLYLEWIKVEHLPNNDFKEVSGSFEGESKGPILCTRWWGSSSSFVCFASVLVRFSPTPASSSGSDDVVGARWVWSLPFNGWAMPSLEQPLVGS